MTEHFDSIVLGLGAMGSSAAYQLAKRGNTILGIDQFTPPHIYGSSHGGTRIIRQAIGEGEELVPVAIRSYEIFEEIERETKKHFLNKCGVLVLGTERETPRDERNFYRTTVEAAKHFNIDHEILNADEMRRRFPRLVIQDDEVGFFENSGGYINPEESINANLELASKYGAVLHTGEKVTGFEEKNNIVHVNTDQSTYSADKLIICAGPWLPKLLGDKYSDVFSVTRQIMYWFEISEHYEEFLVPSFPVYLHEIPGQWEGFYAFPSVDGPLGGIKVSHDGAHHQTTADSIDREVSEKEIKAMYETRVEPYFRGVSSKIVKAQTCMYTDTRDGRFVIDKHPDFESVIIASPCSGHGFKHSAAIGEILSQLVIDGVTTLDISQFSIDKYL